MKEIVVTGATSFLGTHLIQELLKRGYFVWAVLRPQSPRQNRLPLHKNLKLVQLDMENISRLEDQISSEIDGFYHLAWAGVRQPLRADERIQEKNCKGAIAAYQTAARLKAKMFIGAGSQAEYGRVWRNMDEDCPCHPTEAYGAYKLKAYKNILALCQDRETKCVWPRIFSLYGAYDAPQSLLMLLMEKLPKGESVALTACTQLWDYLYVVDAAKALLALLEADVSNGVYHVASGQAKPLREYILALRDLFGSKSVLRFGAVPYGVSGKMDLAPNVEKITEATGWRAQTTFEDGIKAMLKSEMEK